MEAIREEANKRYTGSWFRKYQTQADELQDHDDFSQTRKSGKMLDEFISEKQGVQAQDSDDDDIYKRYQEMASRDRENKATEPDFSNFMPNEDELKPKMPSLEEYFKAESEGIHPFDRITNNFEESEINTYEEQ